MAKVNQSDIKKNLQMTAKMQQELQAILGKRDAVLSAFEQKRKNLKTQQKQLEKLVMDATDHCRYHQKLAKDIELQNAGKLNVKDSVKKENIERISGFIDVVEKEDYPPFQEGIRSFNSLLDELARLLK